MSRPVRNALLHLACCGLPLATGGCAALIDEFSGRKEACAIIAGGVPAQARIERLFDTGTSINDDPVVGFVLRVDDASGAYQARTRALVSRLDLPAIQPGRVVPVRRDPGDRTRVAIDLWECADAR